jgi:hypothetical protein
LLCRSYGRRESFTPRSHSCAACDDARNELPAITEAEFCGKLRRRAARRTANGLRALLSCKASRDASRNRRRDDARRSRCGLRCASGARCTACEHLRNALNCCFWLCDAGFSKKGLKGLRRLLNVGPKRAVCDVDERSDRKLPEGYCAAAKFGAKLRSRDNAGGTSRKAADDPAKEAASSGSERSGRDAARNSSSEARERRLIFWRLFDDDASAGGEAGRGARARDRHRSFLPRSGNRNARILRVTLSSLLEFWRLDTSDEPTAPCFVQRGNLVCGKKAALFGFEEKFDLGRHQSPRSFLSSSSLIPVTPPPPPVGAEGSGASP